MRTRNVIGGSIGLLLLLSIREASPAKTEPSEERGSSACTSVQVSSKEGGAAPSKGHARRRLPSFSASQILDLQLQVFLAPGVNGPRQIELRVFTPNGHLYQSLTATSSAAPSNGRASAERRRIAQVATAVLPVAGTTIVNSSLYGEWRVEAYVDGERETPCAKPQRFLIEP